MNTQTVSLNLSKVKAVGQIARIGQADSEGTTIEAHVYDGATPADLTGAAATFCMRLPDGTHFVEDGNCTISGNVVTYVVDEEHCASVEGYTDEAYFRIDKGGGTYSTARFRVKVFRAASDGANPSHAWTNGIQEWLDDASDTLDDAVADTEDVIGRAESAIDAMGDISELAVPIMSSDVRGGAKLGTGLRLDDGHLSVEPISVASVHAITGIGA